MSDSRLGFVRDMFQGMYLEKYKVKHVWGAKEGKLSTQLLKYLDDNFAPQDIHKIILQTFRDYMKSDSESQHDFSWLVSKVHKWAKRPVVKNVEAEKVIEEVPGKTTDECWHEIKAWIDDDVEGFMKGFVQTYKTLRGINKNLYAQVIAYVADKLGKDKARYLFLTEQKPLTKTV